MNNLESRQTDALAKRQDWAGLLRYFLAHQYSPALDLAVRAAETNEGADTNRRELSQCLSGFQRDPLAFQLPQGKPLTGVNDEVEYNTLVLLELFAVAARVERTPHSAGANRVVQVQAGLEAAQRATLLARDMPDAATEAFFLSLQTRGHAELGDLETARDLARTTAEAYARLTALQPKLYRSFWAQALYNLGWLQRELGQLPAALSSYQRSLEERKRLNRRAHAGLDERTALLLVIIAELQGRLDQPDAAIDSLMVAATRYRRLCAKNPHRHLEPYAGCLRQLGHAHDSTGESRMALKAFQNCVRIYKRCPRPLKDILGFIGALNDLANALAVNGRIRTARSRYREADALCEEAKRTTPPTDTRRHQGTILVNLGSTLRALNDLAGSQAAFDKAIPLFLELIEEDRSEYLHCLAAAHNNLGNLLADTTALEAAEAHLRKAVEYYSELAAANPVEHRSHLVGALINLGSIQRDLGRMSDARASHLAAKTHLEKTPERNRDSVRFSLAALLINLADLEQACAAHETSHAHLEEAVQILTPMAQVMPAVYDSYLATALNNLGPVYLHLHRYDRAQAVLQQALDIRRRLMDRNPSALRPLVATTLNNLGILALALGDFSGAKTAFQNATRLQAEDAAIRPTADLEQRINTLVNLGQLYLRQSPDHGWPDYARACEALRQARQLTEQLRSRFLSPANRQRVQGQASQLHETLARACLQTWERDRTNGALEEVAVVMEALRARDLLDLLEDELPRTHNTPARLRRKLEVLRRRLRQLQRQHERALSASGSIPLQTAANAPPGTLAQIPLGDVVPGTRATGESPPYPAVISAERLEASLTEAKEEFDSVLQLIRRRYHPDFDPDTPLRPIDFDQARRLLPNDGTTALLQYSILPDRACALIVTPEAVDYVDLPGLNEQSTLDMATAWFQASYNDLHLPSEREAGDGGNPDNQGPDVPVQHAKWLARWEISITQVLEAVSSLAVAPLGQSLRSRHVRRLVISPHRALTVFPLHACSWPGGDRLLDRFEVTYTPSFSLLQQCKGRGTRPHDRLLLLSDAAPDLQFGLLETEAVRRKFRRAVTLRFPNVDPTRLANECRSCNVLHFTGHAVFNLARPLESALFLGPNPDEQSRLTVRDILCQFDMPHTSLVVLNGCETGMLRPDRLSNSLNLASAFLYAGATNVVSTLWSVPDLSSALLLDRFYDEWLDRNQSVGSALRHAQIWLKREIANGDQLTREVLPVALRRFTDPLIRTHLQRSAEAHACRFPDSPPFASPVYWAPFTAAGIS